MHLYRKKNKKTKDNVKNIHAYLMRKHKVGNSFPRDIKKLIV